MLENIKIGVQVSSDGTLPKVEKEASGVHEQLAKAASSSDKLNNSLKASKSLQMAAAKKQPEMTGQEYGKARSLTGASGASARDFADQSRGLGGLVRLYATYAANLFAVSAAFSALKTSMDTTNMVRGMDQLGAISGVAIGTLSKNLVAATDGALSLREAAQATTKIISSGIDSSAIEKIGKVAKGASQALGIDMQDAVSRLTRGITKLEPELLDELGIFVKIDDVVAKYATSVGKSATALTDFERRQAFANAVLEQGQKKFGDIKLETNPYDKLLASVKDLGQNILEVVNKALVPFLNVLSSSPTALFAVVASLATMLVKQAIPAIGQFRQGLQEAEVSAAAFAKQKAGDAIVARAKQMKAIEQMIEQEADLQIEKTDAAAKKVAEIQTKSQQKAGSAAMGLLDAPAQERTKEMYAAAQAQAEAIDQQVKSIDKRTKAGKAQVAILLEEKDAITQAVQVSKASQAAEEALEAKKKIHREELEKDPKRFGAVGVAQANAAQAEAAANRTRIISNAGVTGSLVGVRAAYTELKAEFAAQGKTMWSAPFTAIGAGAAAVTGRLSALLGSLGPYMMALQIAVAVGTALNAVFSKNSEQAAKFNGSLDSLSKAIQTAGDNAAYFIKQDWDAALPLAVVTSRATALKELSTAITNVAKDFDLVASKRGMWDGFWNGVFAITPFAKSDKQAAAKKLSEGIEESISLVPYGPLRKEYEEKVKKILNISGGMTSQNIEFKFKTMGEKEAIAAGKAVALVTEQVANKQKAGAQAAADVDNAFKDTTIAYQELARSLSNISPLESFANKLLSISATLADSLKSPEEAFASLTKLLSEPKKMALLGPESFAALQASKAEIVDISKEIKKLEAEAEELDKKKKQLPEATIAGSAMDTAKQRIDAQIKEADDKLLKLRSTGAEIASKIYNSVNVEAFKTAGKIFAAEMNAANAQAGLTIRKAYSSLFTGQAAINEQASVAKEDLAIKRNLILITADLIKSNFLLINSNKEKLVEDKKSEAQKTLTAQTGIPGTAAEKLRAESTAYLESGYSSEIRPILAEKRVLTAKQPGQQAQAEYTAMEAGQRQALQPFLDAIRASEKQLVALGAADKSIDIDKELKTKQESVRLSIIQKNYEVQVNELALKRRDILDQLVGKTTEQTVKERISLENALEANKQKAKEMDLEGRIAASQSVMEKSDFNKQPKAFKENIQTQLAQDQTSLADIKAASEREKSLKAEADQLRVIDAIYKQRLESIDKAAQASKDDADKKQSDTAIAKTAREQELSSLVALDVITERTRISRQLDIDLLSIKNDKEQKTTELQIEQDKQLGEIAAKKAFINSFTSAEVVTEQAKIDALTKQANLVYKAIDDAKASNMTEEEFLNFRSEKGKEALDILRQQVAIDNGIVKLKTDQAAGLAYQNKEETRVNTSYATRQNIIDAAALAQDKQITKAAALAIIIDQQNQKLADQNAYLDSAKNISETLNSTFALFGESMAKAGEGLAGLINGFAQAAVEAEKYGEARSKAQQKVDNAVGDKDKFQAQKDLDKLDEDNSKRETARDIQMVSSTKKLFKEKTVAYKLLAATEKAMHVATLFMEAKSFALKMGWLTAEVGATIAADGAIVGSKVATAPAKVAADVPAILSSFASMGPVGYAIGAALVATLLSMVGGGGGKAAFVPTSEQRRETQGTAMGYNSEGAKVQVRRGVFGDTDAKSESIANSLEIIKDNSIDGLAYDNKMLNALNNLNEALNSAAKGLFGVKGLRAGSLSGAVEGTNTSGGFLGIGGLFSKSTTKSIIDSGLQLKGTFYDLAKGVRGTINTFETISTTVKNSGFLGIGGSTRTSVSTQFKDLYGIDPKSFEALSNTFNYAADLLYSTAETAGVASDAVTSALKSLSVDEMATLRGLTGEDFAKELSAVIGSVLDDASYVIFASFEKYAKFGEGMLETVIRVVDTNIKIDQALKNMGVAFDVSKDYTETISGVTTFFGITIGKWSETIGQTSKDITEALADSAGGLDKFLEQAQNFRENFLTEAEQLAPIQKAVITEMARLGFASTDTRDEFKLLVQGLDLSTKSGRDNYQALMNVQEGFIAVTAAAVKEAEQRKTLDKKLAQVSATKEALREMELEGLFESNRELQREIWLKEDQVAATKALQTSLQNTTKTIKSQITSLSDYKTAMQSGANSTLTATQQYTLAKTEVDALTSTISKSANTPEEVEARSTAISKLTSATDKWLSLSRSLYASGSQYTVDFNSVMGIIATVGTSLENQLTDAERQLTALETSNTYLEVISTSSKTTASLLETYLNLGGKPLTTPGFAVGTNYVPNDMMAQIHKGERIIPVADNFKLISRLTDTDNYTRDMCVQIRELNQKITSLERTVADGAIMNAQATDRNTEQVTQAVTDGSDKTIQVSRIQNRAIIK
jgi:hypothetical protein